MIDVYIDGKHEGQISESVVINEVPARDGTGCHSAGRSNHKMYRHSSYYTFCICKDCDFEI